MSLPLRCLNAMRPIRNLDLRLKVAFFTTARTFAGPADKSYVTQLLSLVDEGRTGRPLQAAYTSGKARPQASEPAGIVRPSSRMMDMIQAAHSRKGPAGGRSKLEMKPDTAQEFQKVTLARDLTKLIPRRWAAGDVYGPSDMTAYEMSKWKRRGRPDYDAFDVLNINPLEEYKNFTMLSEFMTPMGRIKHNSETGLRPINQRRIAKAIRRSIGLGLMPSAYHHPEILNREAQRNREMSMRSRY